MNNEHGYTLVGDLPDYYPQPIKYAWFPTNHFNNIV